MFESTQQKVVKVVRVLAKVATSLFDLFTIFVPFFSFTANAKANQFKGAKSACLCASIAPLQERQFAAFD